MFNFWRVKNLIDQQDCQWVFSTFMWALQHFDGQVFYQRTQLIQHNDAFFPGKINNPESMAETVFNATVQHAGLQHWPFQLQHRTALATPNLNFATIFERKSETPRADLIDMSTIYIHYNLQQTTQPGDLGASFSHLLAQHLLSQSQLKAPGGPTLFLQSTEIIAVIMGFGVMLANSAYTFRGSCARCFNPQAHRQASLSEDKVIFALALFCQLKEIPDKQAMKYLKPYLRRLYKQALAQIKQHPVQLETLLSLK